MGGLGQRNLIDYGIQTDESDFRIHVGFKVGAIYFFPTQSGKEAIKKAQDHQLRTARQKGVNHPTALGYPICWQTIRDCKEIAIPSTIRQKIKVTPDYSTTNKGRWAVWVVKEMLFRGLIPITLTPKEITEKELQIRGEDIIVTANASIQVKCDYRAGNKEKGGTGNLYLQIAECNPLKRY